MLRIGNVYKRETEFLYVADKFQHKGKYRYIVQKVYPNGNLGSKFKTEFKRGKFLLSKDVEVHIEVLLPKEHKELVRWLAVVDKAIECSNLITACHGRNTQGLKRKIAEMAFASCYYYNHIEGRYYDLRDFGKALGFKRPSKLYPWVGQYLEDLFTDIKYNDQVPDCADSTIVSTIRNYTLRWKCYHGFSKKLDKLLTKDFKAYNFELKTRGLNI